VECSFLGNWSAISEAKKPIIAAVNGFALGGGCELAMMCDILIAGEKAEFGQPEIIIGTIPGAAGTQRLTKAVGKSKAMDMILTARMMSAQEAEQCGLVSRVVPLDKLMIETIEAALTICAYPRLAVLAAKESVQRSFESNLSDGVMYERRLFHSLFSTYDQKEGMDAFVNKRSPLFKNK
jgi:enoyl-CoA hydratase